MKYLRLMFILKCVNLKSAPQFLISNFRRVLNVVFFLLGEFMASVMCRRFGTLCSIFIGGVSRKNNIIPVIRSAYTAYKDGTGCYETSAHKFQKPGNHSKERIQLSSLVAVVKRELTNYTHHRHFRFYLTEYQGHIFLNSSLTSTGIPWFLHCSFTEGFHGCFVVVLILQPSAGMQSFIVLRNQP